jgi:hypothetical protein
MAFELEPAVRDFFEFFGIVDVHPAHIGGSLEKG